MEGFIVSDTYVSERSLWSHLRSNLPNLYRGISKTTLINSSSKLQQHLTISKDGCEEKLIKEMMAVSWQFNAVMALLIVAMVSKSIT